MYSKITNLLSITFLLLIGFLSLIGCGGESHEKVEGIRIHGHQSSFMVDDEGNLDQVLTGLFKEKLLEVVVQNDLRECIIIDRNILEFYSIEKKSSEIALNNSLDKPSLANITDIYVSSGRKDFGVYHLDHTDQKRFFSKYELLKRHISFPNHREEKAAFLRPDVKLTIKNINSNKVTLIFDSGEIASEKVSSSGTLTIPERLLFPKFADNDTHAVKAVWENPPERTAFEVHSLITESAKQAPTLAVFLDGLGYKLWSHAKSKGYTNSFPNIDPEPMMVAYPPKTIYNYYLFGTGNLLNEQEPQDKLFSSLSFLQDDGLIIEGSMQIHESSFKQILHAPDQWGDKVDDQIFNTLINEMDRKDFVFAHFHDIDNTAHRHGPYSSEVMNVIKQTGEYLSIINQRWEGNLFVFSDHGLHEYYDPDIESFSGIHYTAKPEDIIGIFIVFTN